DRRLAAVGGGSGMNDSRRQDTQPAREAPPPRDSRPPGAAAPPSAGAAPGPGAPGAKAMPGRLPPAGQAARRGPPWMQVGVPGEKSLNFWPSTRRLLGLLRPERIRMTGVVVFAVASVALSSIGPAFIGRATDIIFSGVVSKQLAVGSTPQQAVAAARASGKTNVADMLARMHLVPGVGIDFHALGLTLLWVVLLYLASSVFLWVQGYLLNDVVLAVVLRLRAEVEAKI